MPATPSSNPDALEGCIGRERPAQPARASGDRLLVHPVQQPSRGDEVARIAVVPVSLEEHEGRSGGAGEEPGLGGVVLGPRAAAGARRRRSGAQMGGAGARVGAEVRIPGAIREGVERQDDAGLAHADAVVRDAPGGVVGPPPRAGDLRAVRPFGPAITQRMPASAPARKRCSCVTSNSLQR